MQKSYIVIIAAVVIAFGIVAVIIATSELTDAYHQNMVQESTMDTIASFDGDLMSVMLTEGEYYSFVLSEDLTTILAHPRSELVDTQTTALKTADISVEEMLEELSSYGSVWIEYEFFNPETGMIEHKTTYLEKHDKYVFGAGYYSP